MGFVATIALSLITAIGTPSDAFVFNVGTETETLDPHRMSSHDGHMLASQMLEGLISRDDSYNLRGGLAESWKQSEDGKTITFKIRKNMKWSNGDALTIEHIRDSYIRAMNPKVMHQYIAWYTDYIVGAKDLVANYVGAKRKTAEKNLGIKIIDKNTLVFKLLHPSRIYQQLLTHSAFFVIHPSMASPSTKAWTDPKKFISNGAYTLKEWSVNKRIVMERNPHYYDAKQVKLPKVIAYPIEEQNTTFSMYRSKQLDWTGDNTVATSLYPILKRRGDFTFTNAYGTYYYMINTKRKPLDDVRVRKALSLMLDRHQVTEKVLRDGKMPSHTMVPPGVAGYQNNIAPLTRDMSARMKEAKKLLAEAGFPNGKGFPELEIMYNTQESHKKIAQAIQQMWKKNLGITVKIRNMEWKVYLKEQRAKNFDIARMGWIGDYPDPLTFLEIMQRDSEHNHTNWGNDKFDAYVKNAMAEANPQKRFAHLAQAEKILADEMPVIPIYHYVYYGLLNPKVKGFKANIFGLYLARYLSK
jgi:oligopeptide transport system substrate-binding protein